MQRHPSARPLIIFSVLGWFEKAWCARERSNVCFKTRFSLYSTLQYPHAKSQEFSFK
jgi:hypothetical protein